MGYNKTPQSISKMKPVLDLLVKSETSLEWETENAKKLGYHIREAIESAIVGLKKRWVINGINKKELENYAKLKAKYLFKESGSKLIGELRLEIAGAVHANQLAVIRLQDVTTLEQIVGAIVKYFDKEKKERIVVPNPILNDNQKERLSVYLNKKRLKMTLDGYGEMLIFKEEG